MSHNSLFAKSLRFIGIVLMALTGGFTLLGGIGTTCAALFPTRWESMAPLAPFQWLYILFVLIGSYLGVLGIRATGRLIKGMDKSYREALIVLIAGVAIGAIHIFVSRALRGKSMPVDAVVYTNLLTLAVFLLFRIPFLWKGVDFSKSDRKTNTMAGGAAAILLGLMMLTIQYTMGSTHTWNGINYANTFNLFMTITGFGLLVFGTGIVVGLRSFRITVNRLIAQKRNI